MSSTDWTYDQELAALDAISPSSHPARDATELRRIIAARQALEDANHALRRAVADARAAGESWTVIGAALDISRQAAQQRFGDRAEVIDGLTSEATQEWAETLNRLGSE
jgi:hypothetical protein